MALTRKSWLWRIGRDDENEKINAFLDAQPNIAESMKTLVLYAQSRFGNRNITLSNIREILSKDVLLSKDGNSVANTLDHTLNNDKDKHIDNRDFIHKKDNETSNTLINDSDNTSVKEKQNSHTRNLSSQGNDTVDYSKVDITKF
ncbi:MAG: hypothetical protein K0Q87_179 [Neobacillus sp.]|jgi:hypothetical protein|nr:hypothetical protein [Neobacillus sp.]